MTNIEVERYQVTEKIDIIDDTLEKIKNEIDARETHVNVIDLDSWPEIEEQD